MSKKMYLLAGALLLAFGLSGNASASGCIADTATFGGSIGSTTSCADYNDMAGCVIGSGQTSCSYTGTSCSFTVSTTNGPVGSSDTTSYSVSGDCDVKMAITQGNQGANYCQYIYPNGSSGDTLQTEGNKEGQFVPHKQLEVCTDEVTVVVSSPIITLDKKVVRVEKDASGNDVYDCDGLEASDEIYVIAQEEVVGVQPATKVAYCYTLTNRGEGDLDALQDSMDYYFITDDNATPDNPDDDFPVYDCQIDGTTVTSLPGNNTSCRAVELLEITTAGKFVNTAYASGTFDGPSCEGCLQDSDTAVVNAEVTCDERTQGQASSSDSVVETRSIQGTSRCGPKTNDPNSDVNSVGLLCDSTCDLRMECDPAFGGDPALCPQPCKPSGNWTYGQQPMMANGTISSCVSGEPSPGKLPLCQEVLTNPGNNPAPDCSGIKNPALIRSDGHSAEFGRNPYLYYFPASGGGNSIGTIYCILYPGESPGVCPSGSIVY